jgi:hypothetical protein
MKRYFTLFLLMFAFTQAPAQVLAMDDLIKLHKLDADDANTYLLGLGWEFGRLQKDSVETTVSWSFDSGVANIIITYHNEGMRLVTYGIQEQVIFLVIQTGIESAGFKKISTTLNDNSIETRYDKDLYAVFMEVGKLYKGSDTTGLVLSLYLKEDID